MKIFSPSTLVVAALVVALAGSGAVAGPLNYTVDSTLSSLQFSIYIGGSPDNGGTILTAPQSPGSDLTALGGTLVADVSSGAINFPGGSAVTFANQPVDQEPDVGGGPSPGIPGPPAPAQYGLNVILLDSGPVAIRDALADITSPGGPIGLVAGAFDASQTSLGTTAGSADFNLTGLFATNGSSPLAGNTGANSPGAGTVATVGSLTTITIPVNVDVPLSINGLTLDAIFTGQIVASVTAVPEPEALALAGIALVLLFPFVRRRRTNVFT